MALTTVAKVKQFGQIESFADDLLLQRMIDSASEQIEQFCGRTFLSSSYVEVRDGTGQVKMTLRHAPVTAIASLAINGNTIPPRPTVNASGYTFDEFGLRLSGYEFTVGLSNVEVAYTAGFANIPADVDMACCEMVAMRYKRLDRLGVSSKSLAGESISFSQTDFNDAVRRTLNQYRLWGQ